MDRQGTAFWRKKRKNTSKDSNDSHKGKKSHREEGKGALSGSGSSTISHSLPPPIQFWCERRSPEYLTRYGRKKRHTISVALPGSFIKHCQTLELKTVLIGQLARTLSMYEIDEIVIFVDNGAEQAGDIEKGPSALCYHLLQYMEAPPYLRKKLFPMHPDLKFAGLLPSLDSPHHMRREDVSLYREGIVTSRPAQTGRCYVDVGLQSEVLIDHQLRPGVRVTVKLTYYPPEEDGSRPDPTEGIAVSPREPTEKHGLYWGFQTRLARSFGEVFTGCPFAVPSDETEGVTQPSASYDYLIGHSSKRGLNDSSNAINHSIDELSIEIPRSEHYLLVFGGPNGLEECAEADEALVTSSRNVDTLFDLYWNACPKNGCKNIKTEEEVLISLTRLVPAIRASQSNTGSQNTSS